MSLKESSDELNAAEISSDSIAPAIGSSRTMTDYLALAIATCGVGYLPLAPGTWGSVAGVALFLLLTWLAASLSRSAGFAVEMMGIVVVTLVGIWAASRTERVLQVKDPGKVVVDEVAGQMIALLPVLFIVNGFLKVWITVSFILFRFFDIVKPYPARRLEALHGGLGIMADDTVAGIYAAVATAVAIAVSSTFFF